MKHLIRQSFTTNCFVIDYTYMVLAINAISSVLFFLNSNNFFYLRFMTCKNNIFVDCAID